MQRYRRSVCVMLVALLLAGDAGRAATAGGIPTFKKSKPKTCLEQAAREVDRLERELHQTGTVVIKAPDIWGESRLTKHRQEFERAMERQINEFELLLNASTRRSDQAYLASALAIQAAAVGGTMKANTEGQTFVNSLTTGTIAGTPGSDDPSSKPLESNTPIARTTIYTGTTGTLANFSGFDGTGVGLEPTIRLDELKRYLDHLNEIRRVNEGDDTSDSPGYSLNLVRIPVSLLPGEMTRAGHGAEITITARPHVTPELLPRVYRDLVINDLVDSLGLAMVKIAEHIDTLAFEVDGCGRSTGKFLQTWDALADGDRLVVVLDLLDENGKIRRPVTASVPAPDFGGSSTSIREVSAQAEVIEVSPQLENYLRELTARRQRSQQAVMVPEATPQAEAVAPRSIDSSRVPKAFERALAEEGAVIQDKIKESFPSAGALARNARQPVAMTQADAVYGKDELLVLAYEYWKASRHGNRNVIDARSFLKEQLDAGYDYLRVHSSVENWNHCPEIYQAIRTDDRPTLDRLRGYVRKPYQVRTRQGWYTVGDAPSPISAAAWLILVEATLLNTQLNQDLQRVSNDPDCACHCQGIEYEFFRPEPGDDAKLAFMSYVNCRWPVHVFALDPVVQQQNIADQYSMRREMQLALALAFSSGKIGAQSMTRYARRLEIDMETVALNRTDVAFGHGSDTFGWRFTPRVQTPPFDSNLKVVFQNMLRGGPNRDDLRKTWELEAGQRECMAIVLMPSFIDHMTFEARGNYFKMTDCLLDLGNRRDLNAKVAQDVRWSQQMQELNVLLDQIACEQANFLPGETERVRNRILQLSRRMPLQTVHTRVPNENTLGGFEMFSSGVTDLAPELAGYYGEPGVNPKEETILYLVGKNFSVHETRVLAGNRDCEFSLISREVMQVRIPSGVRVDRRSRVGTKCHDNVIDVHIATPYGVSSHLEIPVLDADEQRVSGMAWGRTEIPLRLKYTRIKPSMPNGNFSYSISTTNILTRKPYELPMSAPPFGVAANPASVKFEVLWESNGGLVKLGPSSDDLSLNVPFVPAREQYVIAGAQYRELLENIVTKIQLRLLGEQYKKGSEPARVDLILSGTVGGAAIAGEIKIMVLLELESEQ